MDVTVERVNTVKRVSKKTRERGVDSPSPPLPRLSLWNNCDYHHKLCLCQQLPMHLQTVNRDQRGETLPWQRGEEEEEEVGEETASLFFFMPRHCEYSFVSCFPAPASSAANFWSVSFFFLMQGGVLILLPK